MTISRSEFYTQFELKSFKEATGKHAEAKTIFLVKPKRMEFQIALLKIVAKLKILDMK